MSERLLLWRFALGRALIHAGLRVMPKGRVRRELTNLIANWSLQVRSKLLATHFVDLDA